MSKPLKATSIGRAYPRWRVRGLAEPRVRSAALPALLWNSPLVRPERRPPGGLRPDLPEPRPNTALVPARCCLLGEGVGPCRARGSSRPAVSPVAKIRGEKQPRASCGAEAAVLAAQSTTFDCFDFCRTPPAKPSRLPAQAAPRCLPSRPCSRCVGHTAPGPATGPRSLNRWPWPPCSHVWRNSGRRRPQSPGQAAAVVITVAAPRVVTRGSECW